MIRLALIGYGAMGRLVETLAPAEGFAVVATYGGADQRSDGPLDAGRLADAEVAIDFSVGAAVADNVERLAPLGVALVIGTTGWHDDLPRVRAAVEAAGSGLVHGANFSIGVQIVYHLVAEAGRLMASPAGDGYDAWLYEIHHRRKRDAPSGTLREMRRIMEGAGFDRPIDVASNRAGAIAGTHVAGFDADADTIRIEHQARNRSGFALGALRAARWVRGRHGVFEWRDIWLQAAQAKEQGS